MTHDGFITLTPFHSVINRKGDDYTKLLWLRASSIVSVEILRVEQYDWDNVAYFEGSNKQAGGEIMKNRTAVTSLGITASGAEGQITWLVTESPAEVFAKLRDIDESQEQEQSLGGRSITLAALRGVIEQEAKLLDELGEHVAAYEMLEFMKKLEGRE